MVTTELINLMKEICSTPLSEIRPQDAESINRAVHDHSYEELPVPVARFGSSI